MLRIKTVEIKMTVRSDQEEAVLAALLLERSTAESREIYFFETPALAHFEKGIVLRARIVHGGRDDSTVKMRPADPALIPDVWEGREGFKVEGDCVGETIVCAASLTEKQKRQTIEDVARGDRSPAVLFSADQGRFLKEVSPVAAPFGGLVVMGPVAVDRWEVERPGLSGKLCAERWRVSSGVTALEVSMRVEVEKVVDLRNALVRYLSERVTGFDVALGQETKTKKALEHFAGLRQPASPARPL